ncbi:hypothetical protein ALNOE001_02300 [Candidatus Methanobinarius endosymbioticus]|uniref:Uncharacterized protein n=1 Tax=Candidatus Methanobinarius endosymbioticus TaxID=2006182 RepID=A0A366MDI3_9EURY|nr:hypothetical protein ALNOE001_02300 [Candidatus Methanobinarius endosymbioticus]
MVFDEFGEKFHRKNADFSSKFHNKIPCWKKGYIGAKHF